MENLRDFGLAESSDWSVSDNYLLDWIILGVSDLECTTCDCSQLMIVKELGSEILGDFKLFCLSCFKVKEFSDLSMEHQHVLIDRHRLIIESGIDKVAKSISLLIETLISQKLPNIPRSVFKNIEENSNKQSDIGSIPFQNKRKEVQSTESKSLLARGEEDAPIPLGFRSVAWIRSYEAEAIKHCFNIKADHKVYNSNDQLVLECHYFPNESFEVRKFKSNVQVVRVNGENRRVIGWIRLEEASAIIQASESRKDVEFFHVRAGRGGLVQFFHEDLEVARKYRSTTRLLRKD